MHVYFIQKKITLIYYYLCLFLNLSRLFLNLSHHYSLKKKKKLVKPVVHAAHGKESN